MGMSILNVKFHNYSSRDVVEHIFTRLRGGEKTNVFFLNVNCLYIAQADEEYRKVLNSADFVLLDGIGMRLVMNGFGMRMKDDCNGTDLSPVLIQKAAQEGHTIFFLGCRPGVAEKAAEKMCMKIPGINIVGIQDGYFDDDQKVVSEINASGADILFVAMGAPLQEKWIFRYKEQLSPKVCLGVGALLDYLSGTIPRAPRWLRSLHLEWLWRVFIDPQRLARRYFVNVPRLVWLALVYRFMTKRNTPSSSC